jgi:hypothetical protein
MIAMFRRSRGYGTGSGDLAVIRSFVFCPVRAYDREFRHAMLAF